MAAQIQRLLMLDGAIEHAKNYKSIDFFVRIIKNESNTIQLEILRKIILKWIVREVLENELFSKPLNPFRNLHVFENESTTMHFDVIAEWY